MRKALALAERGRGTTSPNPLVGALVVDRDGIVVGRGAHRVAGGPHAEVIALEDAGPRALGATLYCTLEPCSHTGRTGPCAPLVTAAGIARAVIAIEDPNPLVNGGGLRYLRERGLDDHRRRRARPCGRAERGVFLTNVRERRPYVILKAAVSADGKLRRGGAAGPISPGRPRTGAGHRSARRGGRDRRRVGDDSRRRPAPDGARRVARPAADPRHLRSPPADTPPTARVFLDAACRAGHRHQY